jgi:hypothetical protein
MRYGIEPNLRLFDCHLHNQEQLPVFLRPQIIVQIALVTPQLLEFENVIVLPVAVDPAAETPRLHVAQLCDRSEEIHRFTNVFFRKCHPHGCENHQHSSPLLFRQWELQKNQPSA